jgi:hypothetical protein
MYEIKDNFLPENTFKRLQYYCETNEFSIVTAGDKQFSVLEVPNNIKPYLEKEGYKVILSFIRNAWNEFDTDWRIHADNIIMGERVSLASVLYINENKGVSENGTAMWEHHLHGKELSECVSEEEYNRLILEDANDLSKWNKTDYVKSKPNRLLSYSANLFHSKFPNKIKKGERVVLVVFYKKL